MKFLAAVCLLLSCSNHHPLAAGTPLLASQALSAAAPSNVIVWGGSSVAYYALFDGGPQQSRWNPTENSSILSIVCTASDAGTNPALGSITLVGSNDATSQIVMGTTQSFSGGPGSTLAWDPVTTGMGYLAIQLDGGGTVAGSIYCTLQGKGPVAASN